MKILSAVLGVVVVLLIAAFLYEHRKTTELHASLVALGKDRDAMTSELRTLNSRIADLQRRPATAPSAEPPRAAPAERAVTATPPPPAEPVARPGITVKAPAGWHKNGAKPDSYVVGVDSVQTWGGMPSAYVV